MDIGTIASAAGALNFIKESLKTAFNATVDIKTREKITEALDKLGNAQDTLFALREELFRLQTENGNLQKQIEQQKNWETKLSSYELTETVGGAVVYLYKAGNPEHFACPNCVNKHEIQILQDRRVFTGDFECHSCKATYPIKAQCGVPFA